MYVLRSVGQGLWHSRGPYISTHKNTIYYNMFGVDILHPRALRFSIGRSTLSTFFRLQIALIVTKYLAGIIIQTNKLHEFSAVKIAVQFVKIIKINKWEINRYS